MTKIEALAKYLDCEVDELDQLSHDENAFEHGAHREYLVLTDAEADDMAKESILDSVWAFRASFLAAHAREGIDEDVIQSIQDNGRCESNNRVLTSLLEDVDYFVKDAISCDGRGHFMNTYDGEENECGEFYIYRTN